MTGKRVDEAYISLLVNYPGYNISVCNDKLIDLGIDEKDLLGPVFYTDKC